LVFCVKQDLYQRLEHCFLRQFKPRKHFRYTIKSERFSLVRFIWIVLFSLLTV
jgi:hypothetical protein